MSFNKFHDNLYDVSWNTVNQGEKARKLAFEKKTYVGTHNFSELREFIGCE